MARTYVNRFGRFSRPDPVAGSVSNPQSLNRYTYSANDPINNIDPDGRVFVSIWGVPGIGGPIEPLTPPIIPVHNPGWACAFLPPGTPGCGPIGPTPPFLDPQTAPNASAVDEERAREEALKRLLDKDCADFITSTVGKTFKLLNRAAAARGSLGVDREVKQNQAEAAKVSSFSNVLKKLGVSQAAKPNPKYAATGGLWSFVKHGAWNRTDKALTFIHETFHASPYVFTDSQIARALGVEYEEVRGNPQLTEDNASAAWDRVLEEHCSGKPK